MVHMTFGELKAFLETLTPEQLEMPAACYSGDIDEVIEVIGVGFNTKEQMGDPVEEYSEDQPFLDIG